MCIPKLPKPRGIIQKMIEEAAYYRALERGFEPGHELEDWLAAEAEVLGTPERERRKHSVQPGRQA